MQQIEDYAAHLSYWQSNLAEMTSFAQLSLAAHAVAEISDSGERAAAKGLLLRRGEELGCRKDLEVVLRALEQDHLRAAGGEEHPYLERDGQGRIRSTIGNFLSILQTDPAFADLRYDEMALAPVWVEIALGRAQTVRRWTDADDAAAMNHIEQTYGLYDRRKYRDAFRQRLEQVRFHPVKACIESVEWDGEPRLERFLYDWTGCEDTAYTRDVSRLIFAGGIHRLYEPGCKFDYMPVLIGTRQGEGKSTLVRWLALRDEWFGEITAFEGKEAVEQLTGVFIAEASEMLALRRAREQETVKSFITRPSDKYRRPYAEHVEDLPRRSIMIGTTNNRAFLTDKTGNRRFLPVEVHCDGGALFYQEDDCRAYIRQCWAEALARFRQGELRPVPDLRLRAEYRAAQDAAMEDDWREGAIAAYLEDMPAGSRVCIRQLVCEALHPGTNYPREPDRSESIALGQIMDRMEGWERGGRYTFDRYGKQRCWKRTYRTEGQSF